MILVAKIIHFLFLIYTIMLFARILGSWIPELRGLKIMYYIGLLIDPYLEIFRKIIPSIGMMDFSPIVAFFALHIAEQIIISLIL